MRGAIPQPDDAGGLVRGVEREIVGDVHFPHSYCPDL